MDPINVFEYEAIARSKMDPALWDFSPRAISTVERNRVKQVADVESPASQGAGLLELWDGIGEILWHQPGVCGFSAASAKFGAEPAATLAGMVL